jgi:hypothetical protein
MGGDDVRANAEVTLRDRWVKTNVGTYYLWPNDGAILAHAFIGTVYSGDGWVGVVFGSDGEDLTATNIPTLEEAMIWVETTSALSG